MSRDHPYPQSLTPSQREFIEKLVLIDAAEIAASLRVEAIVAAALLHPIRMVKRIGRIGSSFSSHD